MPFPTIPYNASTGSDTSPSDKDASGTGASCSVGGTTLTLSGSTDISGAADDDTDYLWVNTAAGNRKLFQITSFTGGKATCTAIVTNETFDATESTLSWYVNGTRATLDNDTSNPDPEDYNAGWTVELASGTYPVAATFSVGINAGASFGSDPITIKPASGYSTRPIIQLQSNALVRMAGNRAIHWLSVEFNSSASSASYIRVDGCSVWMVDCVVDMSAGTSGCWSAVGDATLAYLVGCYFKGASSGVTIMCDFNQGDGMVVATGCTFNGNGSGSTSVVRLRGRSYTGCLSHCLVYDGAAVGVEIAEDTSNGELKAVVQNCTIVDNTGDGIDGSGTPGSSTLASAAIFNNVIAYNGGYGVDGSVASSNMRWMCDYNAFEANTSGNYNGDPVAGPNDIGELSGDPFTNRASDDYSLNNTAGAGAACRGAAFPQNPPDGT